MPPFARDLPVRFADVDWARVVYYPRFFDFAHRVFEDFFAAEVGTPYVDMLSRRNVGFPTVHVEADYQAPLRFGDLAHVELSTRALSKKSMTLGYRFSVGQTLCAELVLTTAAVDITAFTGVPLPDDVRAAFERFLVIQPASP